MVIAMLRVLTAGHAARSQAQRICLLLTSDVTRLTVPSIWLRDLVCNQGQFDEHDHQAIVSRQSETTLGGTLPHPYRALDVTPPAKSDYRDVIRNLATSCLTPSAVSTSTR
jgi:hypothetical protein